jgi:hypothetical protein
MALVIVGHRGAAPLLHRQTGLGPVKRPCSCQGQALDLRFLVDAEDHGMGRRIDVEADDLPELVGELRVVGDLEGAHPVRLQPLPGPDAPHRGGTDPHRLGHRWGGPVGCLVRRGLVGQRDHPIDHLRRQRRKPRRPGLVADQPGNPFVHEALLPAPNHRLVLAHRAADGVGALPIGGQQHDARAPNVLLRTVAVANDRLQPHPISRRHRYRNPFAHPAPSHRTRPCNTIKGSLLSGAIH